MRHFLDMLDLERGEFAALLERALRYKREPGQIPQQRRGSVMALLFDKPSLRTRVSFEAAAARLGMRSLFLLGSDVGLGTRESAADFSRVISRYVHALVIRTFAQAMVEEVSRNATIPVINGLTDTFHPCQALGDFVTLRERLGTLAGRRLAFIGDGNNVTRSLAIACALADCEMVLAAPPSHAWDAAFLARLSARFPASKVKVVARPEEAVAGADVLYTDVWVSMGQEADGEGRRHALAGYCLDEALLARAPAHAIVMHCLPAKRGQEITDAVLDGPRSVVLDQAENRMHAQIALLDWLLESSRS